MGKTTPSYRQETFISASSCLSDGASAEDRPQMPRPIRFDVGPRAVRFWRLSEIEAYEHACAARKVA
jgi:hypothetical protein